MRKRRIEAKARVAAKAFLAGSAGAAETCLALFHSVNHVPTLLPKEDIELISTVSINTSALPVGRLRDNWHPQFLPEKLEQLEKYEAIISDDVRGVCERLLDTMKIKAAGAEE